MSSSNLSSTLLVTKVGRDLEMLIRIPPTGMVVAGALAASSCRLPSIQDSTVAWVVSTRAWTASSSAVRIGSSSVDKVQKLVMVKIFYMQPTETMK